MEIVIAGGSGFIGRNLYSYLGRLGHGVTTIGRKNLTNEDLNDRIEGKDVLINLMGEPINGRWTASKKRRIMDSRLKSTEILVESVIRLKRKPAVWIQGSAVGIYDRENIHSEDSVCYSGDFLSEVVQNWEQSALKIEGEGIRIVILRMGVVLGKDGGMLKKLMFPCKFGICIQPGAGSSSFPFIHISDLVRVFEFVIEDNRIRGIVNAVSPHRISFKEMYQKLFRMLKPFVIVTFTEGILKLIFGEGASALTQGQNVLPDVLLKSGFTFGFADLERALENILRDI